MRYEASLLPSLPLTPPRSLARSFDDIRDDRFPHNFPRNNLFRNDGRVRSARASKG